MKDEQAKDPILEFCGLRPKMYSVLTEKGEKKREGRRKEKDEEQAGDVLVSSYQQVKPSLTSMSLPLPRLLPLPHYGPRHGLFSFL